MALYKVGIRTALVVYVHWRSGCSWLGTRDPTLEDSDAKAKICFCSLLALRLPAFEWLGRPDEFFPHWLSACVWAIALRQDIRQLDKKFASMFNFIQGDADVLILLDGLDALKLGLPKPEMERTCR